jgi:hypothetical protein
MINLNKEYLTKEKLFKYISDYDVFAKYIPTQEIIVGKNIYSPFRNEENPSFGFFMGEGNEICFHDFTLRLKGDCIKFVMILYNLSYYEALSKVAIDFDMENDFICKKVNVVKDTSGVQVNLSRDKALAKTMYKFTLAKKRRDWELHDIEYWKKHGISLSTLKRYNVEPISHFIVNDKIIVADKYAYVFIERKDNIETYKIYQPFSKDYKWINSHNDSIWQGWSQLPYTTEYSTLIITKSLKDVMAIEENTECFAVALQCENILPKLQVIDELKERFENIIIFYDNDYDKEENWGQIFAQQLSKLTSFYSIKIDEKHKSKDFSDLIKNVGLKKALEIFDEELMSAPF